MSLRLQIAAALGLLAAVAAISAAFLSYRSVDQRLGAETDEFLDDRIAQILAFNELAQAALLDAEAVPDRDAIDPLGLEPFARYDAEVRFLLPDGRIAFSLSDADLPAAQPQLDQAMASDAPISLRVEADGRTYETRLLRFDARDDAVAVLQVGRDVTEQIETLNQLRVRLIALGTAIVTAAVGAGYVLAARLVRPLDKLRSTTRAIADTKDFSQVVPVEGTGEISDVATDFNLMLNALDESATQQRRLVQDASHELRTPLSTLRASVELSQRMSARSRAADGATSLEQDERTALLTTALAEVDELGRLVDELVSLAGFSFDGSQEQQLDLAEVVDSAVDTFRLREPHRQVLVDVGQNLAINGKTEHLVRAVANVLANANKFAPRTTEIAVSVVGNRIIVRDHGPGIPADELDRVFDKFYRSPTVQTIDGSGLGLAFVSDVVRAHGGTVHARNHRDGGAEIVMDLPPAR